MKTYKSIHPSFRLDGHTFPDHIALLDFVRQAFPEHVDFLMDWFSDKAHITLQTSGSTGRPKPIVFRKKQLIISALRSIRFFQIGEGDRILLNLPSNFVAGKMMWVRALVGGLHVCVTHPGASLEAISSVDFGAMVPKQVVREKNNLSKIKKLLIGGAPVSPSLKTVLQELPTAVFHTYGMTETLTHVAVMPLSGKAKELFPYFDKDKYYALESVFFSTDESNRLIIEDKLLNIKVKTNDIVDLKDRRSFLWKGRYDNVINSGGIKIFPEEVERKLSPYIHRRFIVSSIPDEEWTEKLVLILEGAPVDIDEDIFEKAGLRFYEKPKEIFFVERFPETASGKILRQKVREFI